jgi:predicted Zn-dependent protease
MQEEIAPAMLSWNAPPPASRRVSPGIIHFADTLAVILVSALLVSCASTSLSPIHESGSNFTQEEDEKKLWEEANSLDQSLAKSGLLYEDPELDSYLNSVLQRLVPSSFNALAQRPSIKVLKNPLLNAFAMPNGSIYLHSGMLAKMETEDQLATVIGHELIHFTHRHSVKNVRSATNKVNAVLVAQLLLGAATGGPNIISDLTGQLWTGWLLSSVYGYSRELETEADTGGLTLMVKGNYDPGEAIRVFELFQEDLDDRKIKEPFFFGTHPLLQDRIDNYRKHILTSTQVGATPARHRVPPSEGFRTAVNTLLLTNAELDLDMGRLNTAQATINKYLKRKPEDARAYYLLGEIHRRGGTDDAHVQNAVNAYNQAVSHDPQYAEPHRELGLLYRAKKSDEQARQEFQRYLTLSPKATDAPIIKGYLKEIPREKG